MNKIVCRCCLSSEGDAHTDMLTETISTAHSKIKIYDYFLLFSGLIDKNHIRSTKICQYCEQKLRNTFEFRELIICTNIKIESEDMTIKEDPDLSDSHFSEVFLTEENMLKNFPAKSTKPKQKKASKPRVRRKRKPAADDHTNDESDGEAVACSPLDFSESLGLEEKLVKPLPAEEQDEIEDFPEMSLNEITLDIEADYICFVCDKIIKTYRALKLHRTTEHGHGPNNRICNLCSEQTDKGYMKHVVEKHRDYKPHRCRFCSKKFQYAFELNNHLFNHVDGKKFKCYGCGEFYKTVKQLRAHIICAKHTDRYSCPSCGMGFEQIKLFVTHFSSKHEEIKTKLFPCHNCNRIFMMKKFYEEHNCLDGTKKRKKTGNGSEVNENASLFKCELCPEIYFNDEEQLLCHQTAIHENPHEKHVCEQCNKEFPFKYLVERHWMATHQENNVQCDDCGKCFPNRQRLRIHKIVHSDVRDIKCPSCPSLFKDKRYLKQHVALIHSGQKNFKCDVCERLFGTMGHLKCHMGTHFEDLRKFECELCQKKFVRVVDRDRHIQRTHRDERPHKCDMCPKAYYAGNHLREHQRSAHTDVRFECKYCGNRYARSKSLVEHIFSHLGYKPFNCPSAECTQGFVKKETFKKHLTKSHSLEFDEGLHGFKCSFQDILKMGLKETVSTTIDSNCDEMEQTENNSILA